MDTQTIADEWQKSVIWPHSWSKCPNQAGAVTGEAQGFFVESSQLENRRGYLKPAKQHSSKDRLKEAKSKARAAREKIASDLAYELDLPVPPAVLWNRPNPPQYAEEAVVVTLVMYPRQWPWKQIRSYDVDETPVGAALAKALSNCSPMYVFDTWIKQTDHGDHPHNIIWGYKPSNLSCSEIIFLDFAYSLGHDGSWRNKGWQTVQRAQFPNLMHDFCAPDELEHTISHIESFPDDTINEIVKRIPDSHLPAAQKKMIAEALIGRKTRLRNAFSDLLN